MNHVSKTLYIPLYGKAYVSKKGIILSDSRAEQIWEAEGFPLKGKSRSKWLAYYMGIRAAVFDRWLAAQLEADSTAVVVHIGCGMDSRVSRVGNRGHWWYDVDFPEVIGERKRYYSETERYKMLGADIRTPGWEKTLPRGNAVVVMEGGSMYLRREDLISVLTRLNSHFASVKLLMDCYSEFAARASRFKNPVNDVGVTQVYGMDDPKAVEAAGLDFVAAFDMTPADLVNQLQGLEKAVFKTLYAGGMSQKLYRLYAYQSK